jgi:hypothetical protein
VLFRTKIVESYEVESLIYDGVSINVLHLQFRSSFLDRTYST